MPQQTNHTEAIGREYLWDRQCLCSEPTYDTIAEDYTDGDGGGFWMLQECAVCGQQWSVGFTVSSVEDVTTARVGFRGDSGDGFYGIRLSHPRHSGVYNSDNFGPMFTFPMSAEMIADVLAEVDSDLDPEAVWPVREQGGDVYLFQSIDITELPSAEPVMPTRGTAVIRQADAISDDYPDYFMPVWIANDPIGGDRFIDADANLTRLENRLQIAGWKVAR